MDKRKITQDGKDLLIKQLGELEIERKEVLERLEAAREFGDLKENAEYLEAKGSLSKIDQEMDRMKEMLANSIVISNNINTEFVDFGTKVTIENIETKEIKTYKIVGDAESDISEGLLSENSPIAIKMKGKKTGEEFKLENDRGVKTFKIIKIE